MSNDLVGLVSKIARHLNSKAILSNAFIGHAKKGQNPAITQVSAEGGSGAAEVVVDAEGGHNEAVKDVIGPLGTLRGLSQGAGRKSVIKKSEKPIVAVKDNIATHYSTTTCASGILKDYSSPYEATVVQRLRKSPYEASSGSTYLKFDYAVSGKTNMDEFGMGSHSVNSHFGPVTNRYPWLERSAGGSSGGSAVAVGYNNRDFALGTDTGGSVRLPAAYNGVVGFKPSYGRISRWGVIPYANSLDTVGIFGPSISCHPKLLKDRHSTLSLRNFFKRVEGYDPKDPTSLTWSSRERARARNHAWAKSQGRWGSNELKTLRIGVPIEYNIQELHPTVRDTWRGLLKGLRSDGHRIVPVSLPSTKHALSAYYVLAAAEAASNLAKYDGVRYGTRTHDSDGSDGVLYATTRGNGFGDEVKRRILLGSYTLSSEVIDNYFIQAQKVRRLVQRDFDRVFAMPNPLREMEQFDLSDMEESVELGDKRGPPQVDVLVCPTAPTLPPLLEEVNKQTSVDAYMNDVFTVPASLAGLPAISVPIQIPNSLKTKDNVPFIGIQVIGQYWDDFHVMNVGGMVCSRRQDKMFVWQKPDRKPRTPIESSPNEQVAADAGAFEAEEMLFKFTISGEEAQIRAQRAKEKTTLLDDGIFPEQQKPARAEKLAPLSTSKAAGPPTEEALSPRFSGRPIVRKWLSTGP